MDNNIDDLKQRDEQLLNEEREIIEKSKEAVKMKKERRRDLFIGFFGVILPIIAFMTNLYMIPFPMNFYSPDLYLALLIGFAGISATIIWKKDYSKTLSLFTIYATFLAIVYSTVFSIGFIPLIPISAFAIVLYGLGILGFSPFFSLWASIQAFKRSYKEAVKFYSKTFIITSCIIITLFLPALYCSVRTAIAYMAHRNLYLAINGPEEEKINMYKVLLRQPEIKSTLITKYAYGEETPYERLAGILLKNQYISGESASTLYYLLYGERIEIAERETLKKIKHGYWNRIDYSEFIDYNMFYSYISLKNCHYDGVVNLDSKIAYQEITLDVSSKYNKQEMTCEFIVPPGSAVTKLSLWINGVENSGVITAQEKAKEAYNTIVSKQKDPAIINWIEGNRYELRVFPVEPDMPRKVKIGITGPLYPGEKGLAFIPVTFESRNFNISDKAKTTAIIDFRSKEGSFKLTPLSEEISIIPLGKNQFRAEGRLNGFDSEKFELFVEKRGDKNKLLCFEKNKFKYIQYSYYEDIITKEKPPVSVNYFLDSSYAMEKDKVFEEAKQSVIGSVNRLTPQDRFNITVANFEIKNLFEEPLPATEENKKAGEEFLKELRASGGLDMGKIMEKSFFPKNYDIKPVFLGIVHSSHPVITQDYYSTQKLWRMPEGTISAGLIMIGYKQNKMLTDIIDISGGKIIRVKNPENLKHSFEKLENFATENHETIEFNYKGTDALTSSDGEVILSENEPAFFYLRIPEENKSGDIIVEDKNTEKTLKTEDLKNMKYTSDDHIARLWAFNYIMENYKKGRLNELQPEKFKELANLGKEYYMVTPYTSFVVLETDEQYEQFGIDKNYKGELTAPSIPEPETVFMIITMILIGGILYFRNRNSKCVMRDA